MTDSRRNPQTLGDALYWWGIASVLATVALAGRLIWEQTALTWEQGPQMVGFSLIHGLGFLLFLGPLFLIIWAGVALFRLGLQALRRQRPAWSAIASACLPVLTLAAFFAVASISYGYWQRLFVDRLAAGPHANLFFVYAAAYGDLATVQAFHAHGTPVDIPTDDGKTALHAAAVRGKLDVITYLIASGANVNAVDSYGDTPLANAVEEKHDEAARYLTDHGAILVRGTAEQRDKASKESVRRSIEKSR